MKAGAVAWTALTCATASAQVPAAQRDVVASTEYFRFHSDALNNLHDLLNWRTSRLPSAPTDSCAAASRADWLAFTHAEQLYAGKRGPERNRFIIAMRFDASELGSTWTEICAYGTAVRVRKL